MYAQAHPQHQQVYAPSDIQSSQAYFSPTVPPQGNAAQKAPPPNQGIFPPNMPQQAYYPVTPQMQYYAPPAPQIPPPQRTARASQIPDVQQQQQQQQQTQGSSKALLFLKLCLTNFAINMCGVCYGAASVAGGVTPVYPSRGGGRRRRQRRVQDQPIVQGPNWGTWKD